MKSGKELKKFGIILSVILSLIGTISLYRGNLYPAISLYILSLFAVILVLTNPVLLWPVHSILLFISHIIGWINTRLLLGIIFYLVFSPIGLVLRIFRKDLLDRKFNSDKDSYWIPREGDVDPKRCERQF